MSASLYQLLLGQSFANLPPLLQQVHSSAVPLRLQGTCAVERGENIVLDWVGDALDLPRKGQGIPFVVDILPTDSGEKWVRRFAGEEMESFQTIKSGKLVEQFDDDVELQYDVDATVAGLIWKLSGMRVKGIPVPGFLRPNIETSAIAVADGVSLNAIVPMPLVGMLLKYEGTVTPVKE